MSVASWNSYRSCFKKLLPHLQSVASFLTSAHRGTKKLDFDDFDEQAYCKISQIEVYRGLEVLCCPEVIMSENEMPAEQVRSVMTKNIEQAHGVIANYFQLVEKSISASPLGATDQTKTFRNYVERSVAASFGLSDKLLRAKDFQDVLRIQTEFFQTQSKDLCGTATKAASDVTHVPIK